MKKNKKLLIMVGVVVILGIVLAGALLLRGGGVSLVDKDKIMIKNEKGELSVYRNGLVEYKAGEGAFIDNWSMEKTNAFFSYYEENYAGGELADGTGETVYVNGVGYQGKGDELTDVVIDDITGGGGDDGGGGGGGDISDYFGTPTPKPSSTPLPGGTTPTPTPVSGIPSDCLFWRLSYCVKYKPTPTPTPTPVSGDTYVIEAANCDEWNETQTSTTVINNTVCVPLE